MWPRDNIAECGPQRICWIKMENSMLSNLQYFGGRMKKLLADESGATAIEYGLIAALIALAIIAGASALGNSIGNLFGRVATDLDTRAAP